MNVSNGAHDTSARNDNRRLQFVDILVRPMHFDDLPDVLAVESMSYAEPWDTATFEEFLKRPDARLVVAMEKHRVVGYGGVSIDGSVSRVLSVAVSPASRQRSVGRRLMLGLVTASVEAGAKCLRLEVRFGNRPARRLYESLGLRILAVRRAYYVDDDALIMGSDLV